MDYPTVRDDKHYKFGSYKEMKGVVYGNENEESLAASILYGVCFAAILVLLIII